MSLSGRHLIGGTPSSEGVASFTGIDPTSGTRLDPVYHEATRAEIDRAMDTAEQSFDRYRSLSANHRASFLRAIADSIESLGETLIERADAETALGADRLRGERARTINQIKMFASLVEEGSWVDARIDHASPERTPTPKPDLRRMLIPIGPVVVFGASNFPLAFSVAGGDTVSAFAAGCPVLVKAHPAHPGTSELVGRAISRAAHAANVPTGVFSLLHGLEPETGQALVRHPSTKAIGFTGSHQAGRALFDAAAARPEPIPVYAEMGSTNPVFVLPGALAERCDSIAEQLYQSMTLSMGQFCTKPGLIIGTGEQTDKLSDRLAAMAKNTPPGVMLYEGIAESFRSALQASQGIQGVRVARGTPQKHNSSANTRASTAVLATDARTYLEHNELSQEVFGPATVTVRAESREQLLEIARGLEGHLTATIHATEKDLEEYEDLVRVLERKVGRLLFNGVPTGVEVCPSMHHGGPYPATTDVRSTSVGTSAIYRFARPIAYQNFPQSRLPMELRDDNPMNILRLVDGAWTRR